ncbi:MAG: hypothetical protein PHI55_02465 [Burkholderiaceae bacterium]|nr:hypothetical protein [Burkholderiaceae bacterium]
MKKNLLALSIAAMVGGIAGGANAQVVANTVDITAVGGRLAYSNAAFGSLPAAAVARQANDLQINTDGTGHILFVPYFTTQSSNASLLNIVNTDLNNGKAVKLRYRGASNSDDLFDITIYLSPGDMWTANVAVDADGVSRLVTDDKSCTLPSAADIKADGGKFKTLRVRQGANAKNETREGYIEILNMADIPVNLTTGSLYNAIKHVNGVAPCSSAQMDRQENALSNVAGSANDPLVRGYSWPTGGLFANWTIVNLADSASVSGEAVAIEALAINATGGVTRNAQANLVWSPQTSADLAQQQAIQLTADPLLAGGVVRAASYDFPDLSTPYALNRVGIPAGSSAPAEQAKLLASTLSVQAVTNEFLTNSAVNFATDWVFSMPTRRYAVAMDYNAGATNLVAGFTRTNVSIISNDAMTTDFFVAATATTPEINSAANYRAGANGNVFLSEDRNRICVSTNSLRGFDREENTKTTFVVSPGSAVNLCGEVSVLSFNNATSAVLSASLAQQTINTSYADGWFRITTPGLANAVRPGVNNGLPVIGFAAAKTRGANLGGAWAHRYN